MKEYDSHEAVPVRTRPPMRTRQVAWNDENGLLLRFARAEPELIASRALLDRVDTKFVLTRSQLARTLASLTESFRLLAPQSALFGVYDSTYFDTPTFTLFHDHRRGRRRRFKVRLRHYLDRGLTYLEVKKKERPCLTHKLRREVPYGTTRLSTADLEFLEAAIRPAQIVPAQIVPAQIVSGQLMPAQIMPAQIMPVHMALEPVLSMRYRRITLIARDTVERVTFDFGLEAEAIGAYHSFGDAVIAEVKQPKLDRSSLVMATLRANGLRPTQASKYCLGLMTLTENLRCNRLKRSLRALEGSTHG